jgi:hypothetical protein
MDGVLRASVKAGFKHSYRSRVSGHNGACMS